MVLITQFTFGTGARNKINARAVNHALQGKTRHGSKQSEFSHASSKRDRVRHAMD
jgi:hypothetical protein